MAVHDSWGRTGLYTLQTSTVSISPLHSLPSGLLVHEVKVALFCGGGAVVHSVPPGKRGRKATGETDQF